MRVLLIFTLLLSSLVAFAADKKTEIFTLDHQMSQMCQKKINENLRFEKGVLKINISLKENIITITYDPAKTNTEKLIQAFKKIGFNASLSSPDNSHSQKDDASCDKSSPTCQHSCCQ